MDTFKSIVKKYYRKPKCKRICQGDILRDFKLNIIGPKSEIIEVFFKYIVVLSQDCDLEHGQKKAISKTNNKEQKIHNQYLPNVLLLPAFLVEPLKSGDHLSEIFDIKQDYINSKSLKIVKQNKNDRYHHLNKDAKYQVPELIIDFKLYYTLSVNCFSQSYKKCYLATVNELFRENLSERFSNYLKRIAVPEIMIE